MAQRDANVGDYLLSVGGSDDVAVIDRDGTHTYAALRDATDVLVRAVLAWGLAPGSRIGLLSRNGLFWAAAYLAILRAGHVAVPFATTLTSDDVLRKARFVDCSSFLIDVPSGPSVAPVVRAAARLLDASALRSSPPGERPEAEPVDPEDDAVLMFTSGTTSAPRAVRVSHRNIAANTNSIIQYLGLTRSDRMAVVLPFSYCYGASLLHTHLRAGASVSICDTFAFPETVIDTILRDACTGIAGVPSSYQLLLRASSFATSPLPSLRHMQQAGGRLPPAQVDLVAASQPTARLYVMYGATEATSRMSFLPPELIGTRRGSIGRGIPGVTLSVVDDDGLEVRTGETGEIFARGASITKGYWRDPEGTADRFTGGGLRTGDIGYVDADGFIYIVDRTADFIKSWGIRVSSHEIEDAVIGLAGVDGAAAVGRPDPAAGESIVVFYTTGARDCVTPEEVLAHCRSTLAKHQVPHEAHLLSHLPLNSNGKVVKAELKQLAINTAPSGS